MKLPANLTPAQLKVFETVNRVEMAWVALWFVLALFAVGFLSFLSAVYFLPGNEAAKTITGGIDLLLAWALKIVFKHLFPGK